MPRNLTKRFVVHQVFYELASSSLISFATAYAMYRGMDAFQCGLLLFAGKMLSCVLQPFVAGYADRAKRTVIPQLMAILAAVACLSILAIRVIEPPLFGFALIFTLLLLTYNCLLPLNNSISAYYNENGIPLDYGIGRGMGALAFAVGSLLAGQLTKIFGLKAILPTCFVMLFSYAIVSVSFPNLQQQAEKSEKAAVVSSWPEFIRKNGLFCVSLVGIACIALTHNTLQSFMNAVLDSVGGNTSNIGTALFIATATGCPVMLRFSRIRRKLPTKKTILISAFAYLLKCVLYLLAKDVWMIYAAQLLQCISFNFISPSVMYYAAECVNMADMVKGQTAVILIWTVGSAVGSLLDGAMLNHYGVKGMLLMTLGICVFGTVIFVLTIPKMYAKKQS